MSESARLHILLVNLNAVLEFWSNCKSLLLLDFKCCLHYCFFRDFYVVLVADWRGLFILQQSTVNQFLEGESPLPGSSEQGPRKGLQYNI